MADWKSQVQQAIAELQEASSGRSADKQGQLQKLKSAKQKLEQALTAREQATEQE